MTIPVQIDYSEPFEGSSHDQWDEEFEHHIEEEMFLSRKSSSTEDMFGSDGVPYDFMEELEQMDIDERQMYLDELAEQPELWDEQEEVMYL